MAQLMPLALTISGSSEYRLVLPFRNRLTNPRNPGQRAVKQVLLLLLLCDAMHDAGIIKALRVSLFLKVTVLLKQLNIGSPK